MSEYLYGASVQGIQSYIFETGKLKEITGASEIVETICTDFIKEFLQKKKINIPENFFLRKAAGNLRLLCNNEQASIIVRDFPQAIQEKFPGISLSQALVKTGNLIEKAMQTLEERLNIQKNRPMRPYQTGIAASLRAPRTGRVASIRKEDELLDSASLKKLDYGTEQAATRLAHKLLRGKDYEEVNNRKVRLPFDFKDMVKENLCEWLAIIHADGNSLGKILQSLGKSFQTHPEKAANGYKEFSECLDKSTIEAARIAFEKSILLSLSKDDKFFPLRPIILGGDDLTVVCRADLAIEFTNLFLQEFENRTRENFKHLQREYELDLGEGLTACAGIAFIKESYPFHYGYQLAEELCGLAKKASKNIQANQVPSSLAFHKVLSSFHDDYNKTKKRELTASPRDFKDSIHLDFGPYAIQENTGLPCLSDLSKCIKILNQKNAPKSGFRRWLSQIHNSQFQANTLLQRVAQIAEKKGFDIKEFDKEAKKLGIDFKNPITEQNKTPIFDMLTLISWGGED